MILTLFACLSQEKLEIFMQSEYSRRCSRVFALCNFVITWNWNKREKMRDAFEIGHDSEMCLERKQKKVSRAILAKSSNGHQKEYKSFTFRMHDDFSDRWCVLSCRKEESKRIWQCPSSSLYVISLEFNFSICPIIQSRSKKFFNYRLLKKLFTLLSSREISFYVASIGKLI